MEIVRDEIASYRMGITEDDLAYTKDAMILSNARRFETMGALLGMLNQIATYGQPVDYVLQEEQATRGMTLEQHQALAQQYLNPDRMIYLVVGDAATQMAPLRGLGFGSPIQLDANGNPVR